MCIVCGPGGTRLIRSIVGRYVPAKPRFLAEEVAPAITPALDPTDLEDLKGPADIILRGGPILTLRARGDVAAAIAVRAGRVQSVGDEGSVLALRGRLTRVIDLDGQALVPGFVIADWHPPLSLLCDWLEAGKTPADVIAAASAETSSEWMALMIDGSSEKQIQAAIATASRPVVAVDREGAILAASRSAQTLAPGLDLPRCDQVSPQARLHVSMLLPTFLERLAGSRHHLTLRLRTLLREAARHGVTTLRFCGLGSLAGDEDPDLVRSAAGESPPLRLRGAVDVGLALRSGSRRLRPGLGDDLFRIDTATHWIDAMSTTTEEIAELVRAAREQGWRVTLHAESPAAIDLALDAFASAAYSGASLDISDGLEHRGPQSAETWARIRQLGISAGVILEDPSFSEDDRPHLGAPRDVPVSLTCDLMAGAPDPLTFLSAAAATKAAGSKNVADWLPSVTADASTRCGTGSILGSLEVGAYADFAFLDRDPRDVDLRNASEIECKGTWLGGREVRT
jgi:predicted amidohydrolase YtcJ